MNDILIESYTDNIKRTFGGLCVNGIMHMLDTQGNGGKKAADTWLIFGDPSLVVTTDTPEEMTISHASSFPPGATAFNVQCDTKDALISLTVEGEIVGTAYVSNSTTTVIIDPPLNTSAKTVQITVTGYNKMPYMKDIAIDSTAIIPSDISETNLVEYFIAGTNVFYFRLKTIGSGTAVLSIYDALGNCIYKNSKNFTSGKKSAANHSLLVWNCSNKKGKYVAAGIYIAILQCTCSDGTVKLFRTRIGIMGK